MADIEERRPVAWPSGCARVTSPSTAQDKTSPGILLYLWRGLQHRLCARAPAIRCRDDERVGVRLHRGHKRGPARVTVLSRDHELSAREDRLAAAEPSERVRITGARSLDQLLGLLP